MKKLLLTLLCIFAMFSAKAQCDYTLSGTDSWGDGWNGASIDIDVAGVTSNFTVAAGTFNSVTIPSYTGDLVTFTFTGGIFDNEIGITLTGPDGTSLYSTGAPVDGVFVTDTSVSTCAPPSCGSAIATMSNITTSGATATWDAANGAVSYDWEAVPAGNAQGVGVIASGSGETGLTVSFTGLTSATAYDFLISPDCTTDYASAVTFTTSPGCGDTVSACYDNGVNQIAEVAVDTTGDYITVTFNAGDLESCCDAVEVYDTADRSGNLLYTGTGDVTGATAESTTGVISIWSDADGSWSCSDGAGGPYTELNMTFTCAAPPSCLDPSDVAIINIATDMADVTFTDNNPMAVNNYDYELVNLTLGEVTTGVANGNATTNPFTLMGLIENNEYEIYVKAVCGPGDESNFSAVATWSQVLNVPGCASNFMPADAATEVSTSVSFTWDVPTTGGTAASYDVYFGEDSAALLNIGNVQGTSVSLTGLDLETLYYWQIVPKNEIGDAAGCLINSFTTKSLPAGPAGVNCTLGNQSTSQYADAMDAMGGWTGDFNTTSNGPTGMWFLGETESTPSGNTGPTDAQDAGGAYMYYEAGTSMDTASAVSPLIDLNAIAAGKEAELTFYMHAYGAAMGTLNVGAATTATGPFTNIFTWDGQIQPAATGDWLQVGADVTAFTGGNLYIEFSHTGTGAWTGDMSIDTFEVVACAAIPSCQIPDTLSVTGVTGGNATISWNDPETPEVEAYEYEVTEVATGTVTPGTSATTSTMLTGLTVDGEYTFRVRTDCSVAPFTILFSDWSPAFAWTQTEIPGCASTPMPGDTATDVMSGIVIHTWDAPSTGGSAVAYDFYFGTDPAALNLLISPTAEFQGINGVQPSATYYWQVVPTNAGGDATGCPIWSYTTAALDDGGVDCASATVVTEGTYTSQIDDANPGNSNDFLWFIYTATADGSLDINSCNGGADSMLEIYDNCTDLNIIEFNDDECATGLGNNYASQVIFDVIAGQEILVRWRDRYTSAKDIFTWNLALTSDCASATTWSSTGWSDGAPTDAVQAIIDDVYVTATDGNIDACAIRVTANGELIVSALSFVSAQFNITNNGVLTVEHTGNVVQVDDAGAMSGSGTTTVTTVSPMLDSRDFQILGSPMTGEAREDVWAAGYNVQDHTPANFIPNSAVTATYNFADDNLDDWNELVTGALTPGAGYLVFSQDSYNGAGGQFTYDYNTGDLNSGVITQPLHYNGTQVGSPNMLSNPYASSLNAFFFVGTNPQIDAVYFWEHGDAPMAGVPGPNGTGPNYDNDDVSSYNLSGGIAAASGAGVAPNGLIATSQGFGVFASAAGTATFNNAMRSTNGNTTLRTAEEDRNRVWLHIENTEFDLGASTLVGFTDAATAGYDRQYDNYKLSTSVSIFSHIDGDLETGFSIQSREAFDVAMQIPMGFASQINTASSYRVSLSDFDGDAMTDTTIYLVDNVVGVVTNLNEGDYGFTSEMGTFNNRFTLQFVDRNVLANNEANLNAVVLSPNPTDGIVNIVSPRALVHNVVVTDIQGRVVHTISIDGLNTYQLDMSSLGSALYFVQVTTDAGSITKRLIKK
jgi:hypothetical protein